MFQRSVFRGVTGVAFIAVILVGCFVPMGGDGSGDSSSSGTLSIQFNNGVTAQTLLPDIDMNVASYSVDGTGPDGASFSRSTSDSGLIVDALVPGEWIISVSALNAGGTIVGLGSVVALVDPGETSFVIIEIVPIDGVGTLILDVVWNDGTVQAPGINAILTPASGAAIDLVFSVDETSRRATFTADTIPTGYHTIVVQLLDGAAVVAGAVDVVRIVDGATTSGSYLFDRINSSDGMIDIQITPRMAEPLIVSISGESDTVGPGGRVDLSAIVAGPNSVSFFWYVNGDPVVTGSDFAFVADTWGEGYYRIDVTAFNADGTRGGNTTTWIEVLTTQLVGTGQQTAKLVPSDAIGQEFFGSAVAIDGDTVVIGAYLDDTPIESLAGSAYIFTRNAAGVWSEDAKLIAMDGDLGDDFGLSVAVDGDTVVVGAGDASISSGGGEGAAYVFERNGPGNWSQVAKLIADPLTSEGAFGTSVAVEGDTIIVGVPGDAAGGLNSGAAYVFTRDGVGNWSQTAQLIANDAAATMRFGASVAIDSDIAVIGAFGDDSADTNAGAAYIFTRDGGDNWTQVAKLTATDAAAGDLFGHVVAIDRDVAIVGAPNDVVGSTASGSTYVFVRDDGDVWSQAAKLIANDPGRDDRFGHSVAIAGNVAIVGAYEDDIYIGDAGTDSGSAYLFTRDFDGTWRQTDKLLANDLRNDDNFGNSVTIVGDTAIIGSWRDDDGGNSSGSAYVFTLE